jgi:hypothetical protein
MRESNDEDDEDAGNGIAVAQMVEYFLDGYDATPEAAYALMYTAAVIAKLAHCPPEVFKRLADRVYANTEVTVVRITGASIGEA